MNKKVFISYSWGNDEHQQWIVDLATRLMHDSVDVELDRWSLKDGHDVHSFMEEMVKSSDIFRVLVVSNKKYTERADSREGGVGTETQIITPNIYSKEKQDKFIPIVLERDENGEPYLPIYLKSRKYIDFSKEENFENSYEELLRNILEAPSLPKPKLGIKPPAYITDAAVNLSETHNKLRTIESQLKKNNKVSPKDINSFTQLFFEKLWEFDQVSIPHDIMQYGEQLLNALRSYKPLREDFIQFMDILVASEYENTDEVLISFFENASVYERPRGSESSWSAARFEIFKIIFHELFIYCIAVGLKNQNYQLVADLLYSKYYKKTDSYVKQQPENFTFLYDYHETLHKYFSKAFSKTTGIGDYLITNVSDTLKKEDIILADTICYFVSYLEGYESYDSWFPQTFLYGETRSLTFFEKLTSEKHFEKIKPIFNVSSKSELIDKLNNYKTKNNSQQKLWYGNGRSYVPFIYEIVNPDTVGIYR